MKPPHPETTLRLVGPFADNLRRVALGMFDDDLAAVVMLNADRTQSTVAADELFDRIVRIA